MRQPGKIEIHRFSWAEDGIMAQTHEGEAPVEIHGLSVVLNDDAQSFRLCAINADGYDLGGYMDVPCRTLDLLMIALRREEEG